VFFKSNTLDFWECKLSLIHVEVETREKFKNTYKINLRYFLGFFKIDVFGLRKPCKSRACRDMCGCFENNKKIVKII
jgi:hypothetical protein